LVYASSSEVVADDLAHPVPENTDVFIKDIHNARWSYRLAKITSENFLANSEIPHVILRYFNVYGSNSKVGHFLGDQIHKIRNGIFTVIGAHETRSFCHVSDAIAASIFVAEKVTGGVVNIGNYRELTIGEAVKIIANELGYPDAVFKELPSMPGSVESRKPDISKLRSIMPQYSPIKFEDAIRDIVLNLENSNGA
jgi:nucleoside-diphosphate-sugar epimerase